MSHTRQRGGPGRWTTAVQVLAEVRRRPRITRAELARRLGLSSGSATEITARLRRARLLAEDPAPTQGRGRPTTVLRAHADGPVLVAVDLRHRRWRCVVAAVDGSWEPAGEGRHTGDAPDAVIEAIGAAVATARDRHGDRVRAVSVSAPGIVSGTVLRQAAPLGWADVDLTPVRGVDRGDVLLVAGNDATLAAVAEARAGAAREGHVVLGVLVAGGVGGALVVDGRPLRGAHGAAGEFGHLPLGDPAVRCSCGALGCWDLAVGANALARTLGDPLPTGDPVAYARAVVARGDDRPGARSALDANAAALGTGIAGLVNALDPDVVSLAGLATDLRAAAPLAFQEAYAAGLMAYHALTAPPVLDAALGDDAALVGAVAVGLDRMLDEAGIAAWVAATG